MRNEETYTSQLLNEIEDLKVANAVLETKFREKELIFRETEQRLRISEHKSRALFEAIPDLMFRINSEGIYLDFKAAREELFYQSESIIGKNNRDITPPRFAELIEQKIRKTLQTGTVQVFEYQLMVNNSPNANDYEARMVPSGPDEVTAIVRNITGRKKAERELRESNANARAIIDASSDILCLLDKKGIVTDCNQTLSAYFGLTPGDMAGKSIFDFLPKKDLSSRRRFLKDVFTAAQPVMGETRISDRTVDYSIYPVKDENGSITKIAVYAFDNTDEKAARQALVESEEIFDSLLENSPIYVFFKDEQIRATRLSRNYETMLNLPIDLILGKTMNDLFPSDLAEKMEQDDLKVLHDGKQIKIEEEFNGRHYTTFKFPVIIDGNPKFLAGYTIDNTEQKHAELALRESEEKFRKIYTESTTPIAMLDKNLRFISVNRVFQDTFGYSGAELKKMSFREITHPDHLGKDIENINLLIERKMDVYRTEKRYITKNDQLVWGNVQVSIVRDSQDEFLYFLVMINNITGYKLAEAEIRNKNEQLEKINAEKDKFFSIIAHDLRSPFNAFLGFTEIIAEELYTMTLSEIQLIATDMKNSASNLYLLLENLLEWSMIQRGIKSFDPKPQLLAQITNDCLLTLSDSIRKKNMKMSLDIPATLKISADLNMLETVIRNLLSNAVKFTPRGGRIAVKAMENNSHAVMMSVEDNGIGMDAGMIEKLFNFSARNNRPGTEGEPSTGLGLLLCKDFIEKHGGKLQVESKEGSGSRFMFTLPVNHEM